MSRQMSSVCDILWGLGRNAIGKIDDSAWSCVEESRKHVFSIKNDETDLDPKVPEKSGNTIILIETFFYRLLFKAG